MSDKKTISINTAFFNTKDRKNQTRSRKIKPKPLSIISPNELKKNLIKKVKEHQYNLQKSYNENQQKNEENTQENRFFPDEFKESLDYLVALSKENEEKNKINNQQNINDNSKKYNSFYNSPSNFQLEQVDIELPTALQEANNNTTSINSISSINNTSSINNISSINNTSSINNVKDDKPYGCLKNGNKPTYRNYMKTLKNKNYNTNNKTVNNKISNFVDSTYNKSAIPKKKSIKYVTKQIKTRKFKCGKNKRTRKIGVVLKSGKMRSKVLAEKQSIKARPYAQMKNELYKKGFLKIGTSAPKNLVTEIYENCILSGDVLNRNKDVLIHNYMRDSSNIQ